jgi:hypothetical protein
MSRTVARRAAPLVLLGVASVVALQLGCGGDSTGPGDVDITFDDYWIHGYYAYFPDGQRSSFLPCVVEVRAGSEDAAAVAGLTVTCGGQALTYDHGLYTANVTGIVSGEDVTFQVSDGRGSVSATLEVPQAPSDLALVEGAWDFADTLATHTLAWQNPPTLADTLLFALAGTIVHPPQVASYTTLLPPETTSVTLEHTDLSGFTSSMDIICGVFQANSGQFGSHSGESLLWARAAVVLDW